jgi:hypothetical protein
MEKVASGAGQSHWRESLMKLNIDLEEFIKTLTVFLV